MAFKKITYELKNCTALNRQDEVEDGQKLTVTLQANSGAVFDKNDPNTRPKITYISGSIPYTWDDFTYTDGDTIATNYTSVKAERNEFKVIAEAIGGAEPPKKITINTSLKGCTAVDLPNEIEVGQTLDITLKANEGTEFTETDTAKKPRVTYKSGSSLSFKLLNVSEDKQTATLSIVMGDWSNFTIIAETIGTTPTPKKIKINLNLTGCEAVGVPDDVEVGQTLNITLQANEGTEFDANKKPPKLSYIDENTYTITKNLNVSEDKQTATYTIVIGDWKLFTITAETFPSAPVGKKYGAINVYLVNIEDLEEFSRKRYFRVNVESSDVYENVDLGDYVNKIIRIYTPIKKGVADVIRCGNFNTKIACYQPKDDKITLDFGNITIPNHNKDNVDFESDLQLFLPFSGFVNVSSEYIGKTINLQYVINVVTGNGSALLSCDGVIFQVEEIEPKNNVLYLSESTESKTIGSDDWNERVFYGVEPYLLVKWFNSVGEGLNNDRKSGKIGSFTGFSRFDDIEPISTEKMLTDEQKQIYSLLNSGVYVI